MRIAYFDCFSGISGDMVVGALLDVGLDGALLQSELSKLAVGGFRIAWEKTQRHQIGATQFQVAIEQPSGHRHLDDILAIIAQSSLDPAIQEQVTAIFKRLAEAEARVHNRSIQKVHFHEVGGIDAIVDIVATCIGLQVLGIDRVYGSRLRFGTGFVATAHGRLPVPVPAVVELTRGFPVLYTPIEAELVTPTGAAILSTLATEVGTLPPLCTERVGYGAGKRELDEQPNLLRVLIGTTSETLERDEMVVLETNIDDMNPELYGHLMQRLFETGAVDAYLTPVIMKKSRPGIVVTALAPQQEVSRVTATLLRETTTLGVRRYTVERQKLKRKRGTVVTPLGTMRVKWIELNGTTRVTPEYEDCVQAARASGRPLYEIYELVRQAGQAEGVREDREGT